MPNSQQLQENLHPASATNTFHGEKKKSETLILPHFFLHQIIFKSILQFRSQVLFFFFCKKYHSDLELKLPPSSPVHLYDRTAIKGMDEEGA